MKRDLKVPYALDAQQQVVAASTAPQDGHYRCLECAHHLILRRSRKGRPHFAHRPDAITNCSGESTTHLAAKHLLQEQVQRELDERGTVSYQLPCPGINGTCRDHAIHTHYLNVAAWDAVELEVPHGDYRFDVAVLHHGRAVLGFEVLYQHPVPDHKAAALDVPWLEILAEDVLAYRPRVPCHSPATPKRCDTCEELASRLAQRHADDKQRQTVHAEFEAERARLVANWKAILTTAQATARATSGSGRRT